MVEHSDKYRIELRRLAEARSGSFPDTLVTSPQDIRRLVHELHVCHVQLEMQYAVLQRAQEQVEESRDRYLDLYESAPVGYFTLVKDGTIVEVNHAGAALVGMKPFDLRERRFQLMVTMKDREAFTKFCHGVLDTQEPDTCEVRLVHPKSEWGDDQVCPYVTVLITAGPVRAGMGKRRHLRVAAMDITVHKRTEEQLRRSETNLVEGQRISQTGSWAWNASTEELFSSKELLRIFGLDPATAKPSHEDFLRIIHSEDQERIRDTCDRAVRTRTDYEATYRIVLTDGSVRHIKDVGHPIFNQSGTLLEFVGTTMDTTERERIEEVLQGSEKRFRSYFEQGLIGMAMTSLTKGIFEVNDELCHILGYTRSELLQKTWAEMTHPDDLAADVTQFKRVLAGEIDGYTMDKRWIHKDGRPIDTIMTAKCVRRTDGSVDYFVGLVLDITERKRAEQLVKKAHEEVDLIMTSISDQFFGLNRDWRFTYFNQHAAAQMRRLGKDPERLIGRVLWEEFQDVPNEESLRRVMSERVAITDEFFFPPLGEWVENHMYPSPDGGLVTFQRYITARKRAEEALRQAQTELALVARRSAVGEIAASISHEVNQPLAAIVTNSQTCLRWLVGAKPDLDQLRETIEDMIHDARRASEVIARIRSLVKKTLPESIQFDLNELIRGVGALVHRDVLDQGVSMRFDLSSALPAVLGDRIQIQQVLLNLILNGFEAMSAVEDHVRELFIRTSRQDLTKEVMVVVRDTGAGLDPDKLDQIFIPFVTTKPDGMGMGLTISRSIIEAHGGRLWALPNDTWGATFTFTLPMA